MKQISDEVRDTQFETWWEKSGQFCRAGGGAYEKTFAYTAWLAALDAAQPERVTTEMVEGLQNAADKLEVIQARGIERDKRLAAFEQAQPEPDVNAMLLEALEAAEKLEHDALVALSEATYELKVGNTYTTATDTYKANNELIHRLDKILNLQYRDRKRTALTAAKQAQPVCAVELHMDARGRL